MRGDATMTRRRFLILVVVLGCMPLGACGRAAQVDPSARPNEPGAAALSLGPDGAAVAGVTPSWQAGKEYRYRMSLRTLLRFGDAENAFDLHLDGSVNIAVARATGDDAMLHLTIPDARVVSQPGKRHDEVDRAVAQVRDAGCFVTFSRGRFTELRVPGQLSDMAVNVFRQIASALQVTRAPGADAAYTSEEYDTTGHYVAEYRRGSAESTLQKKKLRYLSLIGGQGSASATTLQIVPEVVSSRADITLAPDGRPADVEAHDEMTLSGAQTPLHSTVTLSLHSLSADPEPDPARDWESLAGSLRRVAADQPYGAAADLEVLDAARIKGLTFDTIVARLEGHGDPNAGATLSSTRQTPMSKEDAELFIALSAIFREHPDTVDRAMKRIVANSPLAPTLISALGSAATERAQGALRQLISAEKLDPELRSRALLALTRTPRPHAQAVEELKSLLADARFGNAAVYGLGTYARHFRDAGDSEAARAIGELLAERLERAQTASAQIVVLGAIANSGYGAALPRVVPFLANGSDAVRAAAVRALRSMGETKVDDLLAARLESDPSSTVRLAAIEAIRVRQPSDVLAAGVGRAATLAVDAHVRYRAVELMAQWLPRRPELRPVLEQVARTDVEGRLRSRAQAAL
jgi:HEAT repeat protein